MPSESPTLESQVLAALAAVKDPDRGADIVSLGMVSGLAVRQGNVAFSLEVDPARGPALEPLRQEAERVVHALKGVTSVTAVLTAQRPAPRPGARPAPPGGGHGQAAGKQGVPGIGAIIAVASGKGGVGKSTVAVNLALGMRANGLKVGLLDADVYGPSVPRMLGISGRASTRDGKQLDPIEKYGVKVMSMGFLAGEDTPMIWRGPMVVQALQQMLRQVAWGELDAIIVDMPPGTGDAQLSLAQNVALAGAVIVSTPQDIALLDARKGLQMFRRVDVPVLGIIENMSYFACPHCGGRTDIFSHGGAHKEAVALGTEFLGEIPLDIEIRETSDGGHPIVASKPDGAHAKAFREIAARVWETVKSGRESRPAPTIVIE